MLKTMENNTDNEQNLPYIFDLLWDIKTRTSLVTSIFKEIEVLHSKTEEMVETNVKFTETEKKALLCFLNEITLFIKHN